MDMNSCTDSIIQLDLFELIALTEIISYEHMPFLSCSQKLIRSGLTVSKKEAVVISCFNNDYLIKRLLNRIDLDSNSFIFLIDIYNEGEKSRNTREIVFHRMPWKRRVFYDGKNLEWCLGLDGQFYNSKVSFYGDWKHDMCEHLNRVMSGFLSTRGIHSIAH